MTIHNDKPIATAEIVSEYRNRSIQVAIYRITPQWESGKYTVQCVGTENKRTVISR